MNQPLTVGSLFSGIGGLEYGLELAGEFRTVWQCERDPYARQVLAKHWPGTPCYEDVKELCETIDPEPVDVLCGGFPCQPFSTAGKRKGEDDERYLWPEFMRIVRSLRPRWVIAENVPGLLSINSGREFGIILRDLAECRYHVEWDTVSAASVGALHPGTGCSSWPTPTAADRFTDRLKSSQQKEGSRHSVNLSQAVMMSTPTANMDKIRSEEFRRGRMPTPGELVKAIPTPRAKESGDYQYTRGDHTKPTPTLSGYAKMFPTPRAREGNAGSAGSAGSIHNARKGYLDGTIQESSTDNHMEQTTGQLNPTWVEWLMGFPLGWTDLDVSETQLSPRSQDTSES